MSTKEFWHEDKRLFGAYQKAYYKNVHYNSWTIGLYVNNALETLAYNLTKKKNEKSLEYINEPIDVLQKKKGTKKEEVNENYQNLLSNQNDFINNFLKGK